VCRVKRTRRFPPRFIPVVFHPLGLARGVLRSFAGAEIRFRGLSPFAMLLLLLLLIGSRHASIPRARGLIDLTRLMIRSWLLPVARVTLVSKPEAG